MSFISASDAKLQVEARSWPFEKTIPERSVVSIIGTTASASVISASDAKLQAEARSWPSEKTIPERDMGSDSAFP